MILNLFFLFFLLYYSYKQDFYSRRCAMDGIQSVSNQPVIVSSSAPAPIVTETPKEVQETVKKSSDSQVIDITG